MALAPFQEDVPGGELVVDRAGLDGENLSLVEGVGLETVLGLDRAEDAPDRLADGVALLRDLFPENLLEAIGRRGAAAHEEVAVLFRVLHLGEGRNAFPDEPLRFRRGKGEQSLHR